jgi:UDP-N-acetylmuramoyl-L-alanyl-D-glutamate--2,6-diaminopimelate ligase
MNLLKDILYKTPLVSIAGTTDLTIHSLQFDSRKVTAHSLFVAVSGTQVDGHQFIALAIEKGAVAIVCENLPTTLLPHITYVQVKSSTKALGIMASNFYGNPSAKLKLVAITGTNGKTTNVTLLFKLFRQLGYHVGLLSTVQNQIDETVLAATHTTPDPLQLNELLAKMVEYGCSHCFMEASSHAIQQERIAGLVLSGVVFTNITHDHLDYHLTFDNYIAAKKKLFDELPSSAFALTNIDDKRGKVMVQNTRARVYTFALEKPADFKGRLMDNTLQGLEMELDDKRVWFRLIGKFNAYNLLGAYATAVLLEEDKDEVLAKLSALEGAKGRFEQVVSKDKITAIVDYAHTPDALENVLKTIQDLRSGKEQIITVVGCGGNRDATKRPIMAQIAVKYSDKAILTSDNPRNEEPLDILHQMEAGVKLADQKKMVVISDRKEAIKTACMLAKPGDIILVAGKGHEDYQEIKGIKHPFDDKKVVTEFLNR